MQSAQGDWQVAAAEQIRRVEAAPLPPNIFALLREAAADVPDRDAWHFIASGRTITYAALLEQVERLAAGLASLGVRRGDHVAVMLSNVPEMPATWLELGRIGAVMVPVNVRYTGH